MASSVSLALFERLKPQTEFRGGRITETELIRLDEAAEMASRHAKCRVTVADILRTAARGEILLRAEAPRDATWQPCEPTDSELAMPKGSYPTLPLAACLALSNSGTQAEWRTIDGHERTSFGVMGRYTQWQLPDDEPPLLTRLQDCRITGYCLNALADAFCATAGHGTTEPVGAHGTATVLGMPTEATLQTGPAGHGLSISGQANRPQRQAILPAETRFVRVRDIRRHVEEAARQQWPEREYPCNEGAREAAFDFGWRVDEAYIKEMVLRRRTEGKLVVFGPGALGLISNDDVWHGELSREHFAQLLAEEFDTALHSPPPPPLPDCTFVASVTVDAQQTVWPADEVPLVTASALYRNEPEPDPMVAPTELRRFTGPDFRVEAAGPPLTTDELERFRETCRAADLPELPNELLYSRWGKYLEAFNAEARARGWWAALIPPLDRRYEERLMWAITVQEHRKALQKAIDSNVIQARMAGTFVPVNGAAVNLNHVVLTLAEVKQFAGSLAIQVVVAEIAPTAPTEKAQSAGADSSTEGLQNTKALSRFAAQDKDILDAIRSLGYDPLRIPKGQPKQRGVKAKVRAALAENRNFRHRPKVFEHAWQRLRDAGEIKDAAGRA